MKKIHHEYLLTILEHHLDFLGHVNNAMYLQIFEEARWDLLTQMGFSVAEINRYGISPVVLEAQIRFRREIHLRKKITIRTEFSQLEARIHTINQSMYDDEQLMCDAQFVVGVFDLKTRKLVSPPAIWTDALARLSTSSTGA